MIQSEVINKLSRECCMAMGEFDHFKTVRIYMQMALSIGIEHFHFLQEEIVCMDKSGIERGRFKSAEEAGEVLGMFPQAVRNVLNGTAHTAGGLIFMRTKDYELIKRDIEEAGEIGC
jgi:hypothetical protein